MMAFYLHLQGKAKEVFTYDTVKVGFGIHLKGEGGKVRITALKRREDGIYLMASSVVDLNRTPEIEVFLKPTMPIYSSNYPYTLTGGEAPAGIVLIQNLNEAPLSLTDVEVRVR